MSKSGDENRRVSMGAKIETTTFSCRRCGDCATVKLPRGGRISIFAGQCRCGGDLERNRKIGSRTIGRISKLRFRSVRMADYEVLRQLTEEGFFETRESLRLAKKIATRLSNVRAGSLSVLPYQSSNQLSASSLRSLNKAKRRLSSTPGQVFLTEENSSSDFGEAIDAAITQSLMYSRAKDGISRARRLVVPIRAFGITVTGNPDCVYLTDCPVECKSVSSFSFAQDGFDPLFRRAGFRTQLGIYQFSQKRNRGFLVLVARDSGYVACVEADRRNPEMLERRFQGWMSDDQAFSKMIEQCKKNVGGDLHE